MATYITGYGNPYEFSFEKQADGGYRAYIVSMPSYGSRDTSVHITHRHVDGSRYYVCRQPSPKSEQDIMAVAAMWAKYTDRYIRTGTPFPA